MAVEDREVAALRRLGLTEYESRIYLGLIRLGAKRASELSYYGQVPRTKTYGAIRELERKGLLKIIPGKPETYAPVSPSEHLLPVLAKLDSEVKDSEAVIQSLTVKFEASKYTKLEPVPEESKEFWQVAGRVEILDKLTELIGDAKEKINYSTSAWGLVRAYKVHSEGLEEARTRGVAVRLLAPISQDNIAVAREFSEVAELRRADRPFGSCFVSVDGRQLVVIESKPEDLKTDRGFDHAIWTTNRQIVEAHDELFERIWCTMALFKKRKSLGSTETKD